MSKKNKPKAIHPSLEVKKALARLDGVHFTKGQLRFVLAFKPKTDSALAPWARIVPGLAEKAKAMAGFEECSRCIDKPTIKIAPQRVRMYPVVGGKGSVKPAFEWAALQPGSTLTIQYSAKGEVTVRLSLLKPAGKGDEPLALCEQCDFHVDVVTAQAEMPKAA